MKVFINISAALLFSAAAFSQSSDNKQPELPVVIPPSPTVAALMKFSEIPVSNYTGVPDISIPVFDIESQDNSIKQSIVLKYHPDGAQLNSIASWTGAGWSLDAAGVIARTVKGIPDESNEQVDQGLRKKGMRNPDNHYLEYFGNDSVFTTPYQPGSNFGKEEYLWQAYEKGLQDSEYDSYSFSFFGHSGSFYITREGNIIKLFNDVNLKISFDEPNQSFTITDDFGYSYIFNQTEETHEFSAARNKYYGDYSTDETLSDNDPFKSSFHLSKIYSPSGNLLIEYFYTEVPESYRDTITTYNFITSTDSPNDIINGDNRSYHHPMYAAPTNHSVLPYQQVVTSFKNVKTKKLSRIEVVNKAKIYFITQEGRLDFDSPGSVNLKQINITDWNDNVIKKTKLAYSYWGESHRLFLNSVAFTNGADIADGSYGLTYRINDLGEEDQMPGKNDAKDAWGYYKGQNIPMGDYKTDRYYCTTGVLQKMTIPVGGCYIFDFGSNTYSYDGSKYLGNCQAWAACDLWSDEDYIFDNPDNHHIHNLNALYYGTTGANQAQKKYIYLDRDQQVDYKVSLTPSDINPTYSLDVHEKNYWYFTFVPVTFQDPDNVTESLTSYTIDTSRQIKSVFWPGNCLDQEAVNSCVSKVSLKKGGWIIKFTHGLFFAANYPEIHYTLDLQYRKSNNNFQYENGGGLRINRIGYFKDGTTDKNYYSGYYRDEIQPPHETLPDQETYFDYNFFDSPTKSSGSLAFYKPLFKYRINDRKYVPPTFSPEVTFDYEVVTNFNNLVPTKTQGADVGYKNVSVSRTGNTLPSAGRSTYSYTSPIDFPEDGSGTAFPFFECPGYDYKRGLLKEENIYDAQNRKLSNTICEYETEEFSLRTGLKFFATEPCFKSASLSQYLAHDHHGETGEWGSTPCCIPGTDLEGSWLGASVYPSTPPNAILFDSSVFCCGYPSHYIKWKKVYKSYGWSKLIKKTSTNYFYDIPNATFHTVVQKDSMVYNPVNKKMRETITEYSPENIVKSRFYYPDDILTPASLPGAALPSGQFEVIETMQQEGKHIISSPIQTDNYRNGQLLSRQRTIYKDWSGLFLPELVQFSKGAGNLETRVRYNAVDANGNPLEVQKEGGIKICYIWGYHETVPVAKIENVSYNDIPSNLILVIQAASDSGTEQTLLDKLSDLRSDGTLTDFMITTFTYKPLVGVSTVTDPRGNKTTYNYDSFGRLKEVRDKDGKILSENEYHYRTQN